MARDNKMDKIIICLTIDEAMSINEEVLNSLIARYEILKNDAYPVFYTRILKSLKELVSCDKIYLDNAAYQDISMEVFGDEIEEEEEEEEEELYLDDYSQNMPCDNSGYCIGTSCRNYFTKCN